MSLAEYLYAWTVVNGAMIAGMVAGAVAWCLWLGLAGHVARWRTRGTPEPAPRAITEQDRINADRADRKVLWEIEDAFNRQRHA